MTTHRWDEIEREQLNPFVQRQAIHTERMTISRLALKVGAVVPRHHHENEQCTLMEAGRLRFLFDEGERIVGVGEVMQIPPNVPHAVEAIEDSVALDLFSPRREDWIRGDDAYLRTAAVTPPGATAK